MSQMARERLVSLDILRGLTIMGMILVNSAAGMFYSHDAAVYPALLHVPWAGLTLADTVFPAFLMMVGVSIPLARSGALADEGGRIAGRTARLFVIGFLLSNLYWFADFDSGEWRLFGVLQRIGLVYGACTLLFLTVGPRVRLGIIAAILLLYWPLALLPALDGLPTDIMAKGHNFVASVDRALLGSGGHNYVKDPEGYDPEGLLGTLPGIAHGLIGIAVGEHLLRHKGTSTATKGLAVAGAAMLAGGLVWSLGFPIIKDIWSSSFVLVTCGLTTLVLAGLHAWVDRPGAGAVPRPLLVTLAFGTNAIAAYVLHMVTSSMIGWDLLVAPFTLAKNVMPEALASLIPIGIYMTLIWLCMEGLRRKRWTIKV